jgi:hypothetical protein
MILLLRVLQWVACTVLLAIVAGERSMLGHEASWRVGFTESLNLIAGRFRSTLMPDAIEVSDCRRIALSAAFSIKLCFDEE